MVQARRQSILRDSRDRRNATHIQWRGASYLFDGMQLVWRGLLVSLRMIWNVGLEVEIFYVPVGLRSPTPAAADAAATAARQFGADIVIGIGNGGALDLAKAAAGLAGLGGFRKELKTSAVDHLFGSPAGFAVSPDISLPTLLVPTTVSVAATSGRALLQDFEKDGTLLSLNVAGPGPFGVGQGLQPKEVIADPELTAWQSSRGVAAAATHTLSTFVDAIAAASGTIKAEMLWADMADGLTAVSSALRDPQGAKVDALLGALSAGVAASDADANARGKICVIHSLACVAVGTWLGLSFPVAVSALLPPVLREWVTQGSNEEIISLERLASHVLRMPDAKVDDLAAWVEQRCFSSGVLLPNVTCGVATEAAAAALAHHALLSPALLQRPAPDWIFDREALTRVFLGALAPRTRGKCPRIEIEAHW